MMIRPPLLPFLALLSITVPAAAQPAPAGAMTLEQFTSRQMERIMAADTDGDGKVSRAEMAATSRGGKDRSAMFDRMDANHDGVLDRDEIQAALAMRFRRIDSNGDGVITADERIAVGNKARAHSARGGDPSEPQ